MKGKCKKKNDCWKNVTKWTIIANKCWI